jgi:hypothetical protein
MSPAGSSNAPEARARARIDQALAEAGWPARLADEASSIVRAERPSVGLKVKGGSRTRDAGNAPLGCCTFAEYLKAARGICGL